MMCQTVCQCISFYYLAALNDDGEFERSYKNIYPAEVELKKQNNPTQEESFVDLYLKVNGRQFPTRLFGKRDDFPFSTVRIPHLSSNIPSKTFYSSSWAEILRINKAIST